LHGLKAHRQGDVQGGKVAALGVYASIDPTGGFSCQGTTHDLNSPVSFSLRKLPGGDLGALALVRGDLVLHMQGAAYGIQAQQESLFTVTVDLET